ncbi:MAG: peroxidase-related enzyme [Sphingomonadales bacterium]
MTRIPTPATIADAPEASRPLLEAVVKQLGSAPNMFRAIALSPQALEGYLALSGALGKGSLPAATRERIALAVAEINGCNYCLSAHTFLGRTLARLDDAEIAANRSGASNDPKADAAVRFAARVAADRGHVSDADFAAVKAAGYTDAQVIEIVQHVALNSWTNFFNEVFKTEIDFPVVAARAPAKAAA